MTDLFEPLTFRRGPAMRNRLMLAPMTNKQSLPDGRISEEEMRWLTSRAEGGFGHVMTCASHVNAAGRAFDGELGIDDDAQLPGLTRLATALRQAGARSSVQLNHGGVRGVGSTVLSSSDDPATGARAMTTAEIEATVADFVAAARRAERAGFDGVQLHAAHGYLVAQFLSPTLNRRTDRYGGSPENRRRFLFEIVDGIRAACGPDFQLAVRISPERYGQDLYEILDTCSRILDEGAVDILDLSLWNVFKEAEDGRAGGRPLLSLFTELPRGEVRIGVAGRVVEPADAARCLDLGADYVALGKVAILHHDYPLRAAAPDWSPQWLPVTADHLRGQFVGEAFLTYLSTWTNFVEDLVPPAGSTPFVSAWSLEQLGLAGNRSAG